MNKIYSTTEKLFRLSIGLLLVGIILMSFSTVWGLITIYLNSMPQ